MKTKLASALVILAASLTLVTARASASDNSSADRAAQSLAVNGSLAVKNAGPYIEAGTPLIQVAAKLGQPSAKLPNGSWLYKNYAVENSDASGILVVNFTNGRVSKLSLVMPAVAVAMSTPARTGDKILVATSK